LQSEPGIATTKLEQLPIQGGPAHQIDQRLQELLLSSKRKKAFVQPTVQQIEKFEELFLQTLQQSSPTKDLHDQWSAAGWQLIQWRFQNQSFIALCERNGQLRGRGFYALRIGSGSDIVLQAPHQFFDLGTGKIVAQLFQEHDVLAAAWNTVHRSTFDLAHRENHFINAFTRAIIRFKHEAVIAQIHGFANSKQKGSGRTAEIIISDTTRFPGRLAWATSEQFKQNFEPNKVRLFPVDTRSLGGTQNRQALAARAAGSVGFLHLELNKNLRRRLQKSVGLRAEFFDSLAAPASISIETSRR
jgi:hypothetical protein